MKKLLVLSLLASASCLAMAQERGRVLSVTPVIEQVAVPRQVCNNETVYTGQRTTGGGAVLGAIAGGAVGNAIGKGHGRTAATALGVVGGAVLGNHIEGQGRPEYETVQRCGTVTQYENRTAGYDVVYEYAGRRYTTRTQNDPGRYIPLSVQPEQPAYQPYYEDSGYSQNAPVSSPYTAAPAQPGVTVIDYGYEGQRPYYPYPAPRPYWR